MNGADAQAPEQARGTRGEWRLYLCRRYGARIIDGYIFGHGLFLIAVFVIAFLGPNSWSQFFIEPARWKALLVYTPLMWIVAAPACAAVTRWVGVTPGKLLFGLRVLTTVRERPTFAILLRREAELLIRGLGLGLPFVSLFTLLGSYGDVRRHHVARWDAHAGLVVSAKAATGLQLAGIFLGAAIVAALLLWGLISRLMPIFYV